MQNKLTLHNKTIKQIEDLSKFTGLSEYVIEKDVYVTYRAYQKSLTQKNERFEEEKKQKIKKENNSEHGR